MIEISVVNQSSLFPDADLPALANALQIQASRDVFPIWGIDAKVFYTPSGKNPTPSHWVLGLFDNSDVAGALGYHDETPTGQPLGKVFVATANAAGVTPSSTASHEFLEILGDPYAQDATQDGSKFWAKEMCDMVENDSYKIVIPAGWNGAGTSVEVSNFALPSWWQSGSTGPWDFLKKLTSPLQIDAGGYMAVLDLTNNAGWTQINGRMDSAAAKVRARPHIGSRRLLRMIPKGERIRSTYDPGSEAVPAQKEA